MSRPIDIPSARPLRARQEVDLFPVEDGPYFGYIEVLENGTVFWAVSSGGGKFVEIGQRRSLPALAFIVEKDRISRNITIEITSPTLKHSLYRAILNNAPSSASSLLEFETLLKNYEALTLHLDRVEARHPHAEATSELRLLVSDLLLEKNLYDGIGMEGFRQRQVVCASHLRDIHQRSIDLGLDEIQDCFALGLIPDQINEEYMEALNTRYAELARSGDLHGLQNLCEPIVRSGEIELRYNPSLLLEVLDNGDLELYQYMLALVDRTREDVEDVSGEDVSDVTFDPFHVAIRLGQVDLVQSFVREHAYFEGRASDCSLIHNGQVLTPLTSAVCWRQPTIVRLLLGSGPLYSSSYPQAVAIALHSDLQDMMGILSEYSMRSAAAGPSSAVSFGLTSASMATTPHDVLSPFQSIGHTHDYGLEDAPMLADAQQYSPQLEGLGLLEEHSFTQQDIDPQKLISVNHQELSLPELLPCPETTSPETTRPETTRPEVEPHPLWSSAIESSKSSQPLVSNDQPFMRQRPSHHARREAGRGFISRLEAQYVTLRTLCSERSGDEEYDKLLQRFAGMEDVWETGLGAFRGLYRSRVPEDLAEVLSCLLVADAISVQLSPHEGGLHTQFIHDIYRWRAVVHDEQKIAFDRLAQKLWNVYEIHDPLDANGLTDETEGFQSFLHELVSIENLAPRIGQRLGRRGTRLRTIQDRKITQQERRSAQTDARVGFGDLGFPNLHGGLDHSTDPLGVNDDDVLNMGDFVYLDALGIDDMEVEVAPPSPSWKRAWRSTKPTVALLLASVAFSLVLAFVLGGNDQTPESSRAFVQPEPGPSRQSALFEEFLQFQGPNPSSSRDPSDLQLPYVFQQGARIPKMKESTTRPTNQASSRHVLTAQARARRPSVRGSAGSPDSSSIVSTDVSSTDTGRSPERLRCLSLGCTKTFSSVSNRNKHMREGCALRDKRGYPCRNANCVKVLTTKWYRNTHEQTRCRFKE